MANKANFPAGAGTKNSVQIQGVPQLRTPKLEIPGTQGRTILTEGQLFPRKT